MIPPFPIEGGVGLAVGRAVSVAGLMAAFGGLLYVTWLAPRDLAVRTQGLLRRAAWAGLGLALAGAALWLLLETLDLAGDVTPADLSAVLEDTQFGHLLAGRVVLLGLAGAAFALDRRLAAVALAGGALALQAGHSHAQAMYGPGLLLGSSVLHVLASGAWLGALIPLYISCVSETPAMAQQAARRFSPVGLGCVCVLILTAAAQSLAWIGDLPGLLGTAYGWMAGAKLVLFAALIALAAGNRARHRRVTFAASARRAVLQNIAAETVLGLLVILAAGVLTELPPAMHVQKLWPFAWMPSLDAAREDPDYRTEALIAAAALATAMLGLVAGSILLRGRRRLAAAAVCVIGVAATLPHFGPLLVPAVPTEFFRAPRATAVNLADAAPLYQSHCASCHGATGAGDGPAAHSLRIPPANLLEPHLFMHGDGQLFWWITHGIAAPDGSQAMPGFPTLTDSEAWALIAFIRARNPSFSKPVTMQDMKM